MDTTLPGSSAATGPAASSARRCARGFELARMEAHLRRRLFASDDVGPRLGRYEIGPLIGRGGMGAVYAARDPRLDRSVAIKVLSGPSDADATRQLRREAQALAALCHPHVVQVFEVGAADGLTFVVMELVDGDSFAQWTARWTEWTRTRFDAVLDVLVQTARGLAAAHAVGLVHRDVKPGNVLVGRSRDAAHPYGRARVADFGLASVDVHATRSGEPSTEASSSFAGRIVGTPAYMAPEQLEGANLDARADQYAFCVMAFEAIHGRHPFAGRGVFESRGELVFPRRRGVPRWIAAILRRGLALDPRDRFASMDELVHTLERPRSRTLPALVAVALGGLVASAAIRGDAPPAARALAACAAGDDLASWWSETASGHLAAAFTATAAREPVQSAARADVAMARFAHRFDAAWQRACTTESDEQRDLRLQCLALHREAARALAHQLLHADAAVVEHALDAIEALPDPESCDGSSDAAVHDERRRALDVALVEARVADEIGQSYLAVATAVAVEAEATRRGDLDLQARALLTISLPLRGTAEALPVLERAWELAGRAGDDETAAVCAIGLLEFHAMTVGGEAHRDTWRRNAEAALQRLGDDAELHGQYWQVLGEIAHVHGHEDEAATHLHRALAEYERDPTHTSAHRASARASLGAVLANQGRDLAAVELYRAALLGQEQYGLEGTSGHALVTVKLAAALTRLGAFDHAEPLFRRGLAELHAATSDDPRAMEVATNDFAQGLFMQGRFVEAIAGYREVRRLIAGGGPSADMGLGINALNLANALRYEGDAAAAHDEFVRAVVTLEQAGAGVQLQRARMGLARTELDAGDPSAAVATLRKVELPADDVAERPLLLQALAVAQLALGHAREARRLADEAAEIFARQSARPERLAGQHLLQARIAVALDRDDEALMHYADAIEVFARALPYLRGFAGEAHREYGDLLWTLGRRDDAIVQVESAIEAWAGASRRHAADLDRARAWLAEHGGRR